MHKCPLVHSPSVLPPHVITHDAAPSWEMRACEERESGEIRPITTTTSDDDASDGPLLHLRALTCECTVYATESYPSPQSLSRKHSSQQNSC